MLELTTAQKIALALALAVLGGSSLYLFTQRATTRAAERPLYQAPTGDEQTTELVVQIAGAVQRPGVYRVPPGTRAQELIQLAGGPSAQANLDEVNLAKLLADGEKVTVPVKPTPAAEPEPAPETPAASPASEPVKPTSPKPQPAAPEPSTVLVVNLNIASQADLERVPGIGPVLARRILAYRQRYGAFRAVPELMLIPGIGPNTFEQIKPYVTVGGQ